jgi:uncharacterized protein YciI
LSVCRGFNPDFSRNTQIPSAFRIVKASVNLQFDQFTVIIFERNPNAPRLDEKIGGGIRDEHLARVAQLHESGKVLAAGPFLVEMDEKLEALVIVNMDARKAREIFQEDPIVKAGIWRFKVLAWMVPSGAMSFSRTHFPRSAQEAGM